VLPFVQGWDFATERTLAEHTIFVLRGNKTNVRTFAAKFECNAYINNTSKNTIERPFN